MFTAGLFRRHESMGLLSFDHRTMTELTLPTSWMHLMCKAHLWQMSRLFSKGLCHGSCHGILLGIFHLHTPSIDGEGTSSSAKCVVVRGCHLLSRWHIQWTFLAIVCVCLMPFVRQYIRYIPIVSLLSMYTPYPLLQESTAALVRKHHKTRNHSQFRQPFKFQIAKIQLHPSLKWFNFKGKFHQCG